MTPQGINVTFNHEMCDESARDNNTRDRSKKGVFLTAEVCGSPCDADVEFGLAFVHEFCGVATHECIVRLHVAYVIDAVVKVLLQYILVQPRDTLLVETR